MLNNEALAEKKARHKSMNEKTKMKIIEVEKQKMK